MYIIFVYIIQVRVFLKIICIIFLLNIFSPIYSQENNLFRPDIIGLSINEIKELEGECDRSSISPNDTGDGTYIREIAYGRRYFAQCSSLLFFWFTPDELCHGYMYMIKMPENIEYNMEIINSIFNSIITTHGTPHRIEDNDRQIEYSWYFGEMYITLEYHKEFRRIELTQMVWTKEIRARFGFCDG